ncbi:hypothetical protein BDZ89DRAFT_1074694, partial [Hymenopellis radicata]
NGANESIVILEQVGACREVKRMRMYMVVGCLLEKGDVEYGLKACAPAEDANVVGAAVGVALTRRQFFHFFPAGGSGGA